MKKYLWRRGPSTTGPRTTGWKIKNYVYGYILNCVVHNLKIYQKANRNTAYNLNKSYFTLFTFIVDF